MTVCKFFRQGTCRFGAACKFEHPANLAPQNKGNPRSQTSNRTPSQGNGFDRGSNNRNQGVFARGDQFQSHPPNQANRYGTLQASNDEHGMNRLRGNNAFHNGSQSQQREHQAFGVTPRILEDDLRYERPQWIMSAYGPGKHAPVQLFGGYPLEQSFEEIRIMHYLALSSGNMEQSARIELELANQSNHQVENVLRDIHGAIKYLNDGLDTHPNRLDICAVQNESIQRTADPSSNQRSASGPSALSNLSYTGFGQSGFHSGFGSASSAWGNQGSSFATSGEFMNDSTPFGSANHIGFPAGNMQPSGGNLSTSQPQQPAQQHQHAIGQLQLTGFGQPQAPPFARSAFGQTPSVGFASVATPGEPAIPSQPQNLTQLNGGRTTNVPNPVFDQTRPQQFRDNIEPIARVSNAGFGQPQLYSASDLQMQGGILSATTTVGQPVGNGIGVDMDASKNVESNAPKLTNMSTNLPRSALRPIPDVRDYSTRDAGNRVLTWQGQPVSYNQAGEPCIRASGGLKRIWCPDGPTEFSTNNENPNLSYTEEVVSAYDFLNQNGVFEDQVMPELAPKPEWCRWDL